MLTGNFTSGRIKTVENKYALASRHEIPYDMVYKVRSEPEGRPNLPFAKGAETIDRNDDIGNPLLLPAIMQFCH